MKRCIDGVGLTTENMVYDNNKIWFTEIDCNTIYCYDTLSETVELFYTFHDEKGRRLFGDLVINGDWIVCIPFSAIAVYAVHRYTKELKKIVIESPPEGLYSEYSPEAKFMKGVCYNNRVFMIGSSYPAIAEYDIVNSVIIYHRNWYEKLSGFFLNNDMAIFRKAMIKNNTIYAPTCKGNAVLEFNVENGDYNVYQVGDKSCNYSGICFDGINFWIAPRNQGGIVKWNKDENTYFVYDKYPKDIVMSQWSYNDIVFINPQRIVLLPGTANMLLEVDTITGEIQEVDETLRNFNLVCYVRGLKDELYIFSANANFWIKFRKEKMEYGNFVISEGKVCLEDTDVDILEENKINSLQKYISYVSFGNCDMEE